METFENRFIGQLQKQENLSDIVFVCIGTNKLIGDSIGPMVGESLKLLESECIHVYGTMDNNVNFINGMDVINEIYVKYKNPYLITIDAALSNRNKKGDIVLGSGYMKIGKALKKSVCFFSDLNIKCVIGNYFESKEKNLQELKKVKAYEVYNTSRIVSNGIKNSLKKLNIYV